MKVKHLLQCHLLLTGLPLEIAAAAPRLFALESLLALAGTRERLEMGAEAWLCQAFDVARQDDWPVAPFTALRDGLVPGDAYWLRADPVHFHLLRDRVIVADCLPFDLAMDEAQALIATLNQHFVADGLQFIAPHASRWYLRLDQRPALTTYTLAEAIGQDANRLLPQGAEAMAWHGWLNEAQMLLHEHPVNLEREQRGELPVNSIWLWGSGVLPQPVSSAFTAVWSENALAQGLVQAAGGEALCLPFSAGEWLEKNPADGAHLIVFDSATQKDGALAGLEQHWFAPLFEALKRGRVTGIHLHLAQPHQVRSFTVVRNDLWKFWRRPKPLATFFNDENP